MFQDYLRIAVRNIRSKRVRSWLTLIGIFIGIAAVVSLIGLGEGLREAITSQFGVSSTEVITIQASGVVGAGPPGTGVASPLTRDDMEAIERLNTIETAIPRNLPSLKIEFNDVVRFGYAMNIPDGEDRTFVYDTLGIELEAGRLLKDGDRNKVVLGNNFYSNEDRFGEPIQVGNTILLQDKSFDVIGIAEKEGSFIFDNIIYMNEEPLQDLMDIGDEVDFIVARAKDKDIIDEARADIERLLRKRRDVREGEEDFTVSTPESSLRTVNQTLTGVQVFIAIIASISIIVGALGIINTMLTSVLERRRQIGIMKSIGARNSDIFYLFFIESGIMGLIGGAIGAIVGSAIAYVGTLGLNNFLGSSAAPQISLPLIFGALLGSFAIGAVAGVIPALRAAHENPVEALEG